MFAFLQLEQGINAIMRQALLCAGEDIDEAYQLVLHCICAESTSIASEELKPLQSRIVPQDRFLVCVCAGRTLSSANVKRIIFGDPFRVLIDVSQDTVSVPCWKLISREKISS
jgi:hypothetical protein